MKIILTEKQFNRVILKEHEDDRYEVETPSKIKEKVYRGVPIEYDSHRESDLSWTGDKKREGSSIYFSFNKEFASQMGQKVLEAFIDVSNPFEYYNESHRDLLLREIEKTNDYPKGIPNWVELQISQGNWGLIEKYLSLIQGLRFDSARINEQGVENIIVFDENQIHYI